MTLNLKACSISCWCFFPHCYIITLSSECLLFSLKEPTAIAVVAGTSSGCRDEEEEEEEVNTVIES